MNRKAIYHERDRRVRVISLSGEMWQAQALSIGVGTKTFDPWEPIAPPTDLETATQQMNARARG